MAQYFISYSRKNQAIVEHLYTDLKKAHIDIWIDKVGLQPGIGDWDEALRSAILESSAIILVASPDSRRSDYVRNEVALAKDAKKPIYPVWVEGDNWLDVVPLGFSSIQNVDLRGENYARNLPSLIGALSGKPVTTDNMPAIEPVIETVEIIPVEDPRNPYKGLRAFREEDSGDFFGRSSLIDDLLKAIEDENKSARLLAVLGASGSGKSSVMMAGVLPQLRGKHPDWIFLDPIVPSANPLESLTITLARQFENKSQKAIREDLLDRTTRGLHALCRELSDKPVILYIDQFEEVFTLVEKETDRRQFIDLITTAANQPDGVITILLSMRADFYDRPAQYREFGNLIEKQHVLITPMTLADLYDVVQLPAQLPDVGMNFDDNLVTEMVFAVREEAAALPLLQFTLDQLFQRREGNRLTKSAYDAIGGVQGALAQHAEATFNNLPSDGHKTLARALFLRLIEAGHTEQDTTRRRASYSELTLPDVTQTRILQETADAFVNARLLVSDVGSPPVQRGDGRGDSTLEVSHEALIREWGRLGDWLRDAREDLRLQKSLSADVAEWQRRSKPDDMLYRGTVLAEAQTWAERNTASRDETTFINESIRAETERQSKEQRAAHNLRYAVIGLGAVVVLASIGLVLIFARNNADLQVEADAIQATSTAVVAQAGTIESDAYIVQTDVADDVYNAESIAGTSEYQADYVELQVNYAATRDFGISPFDITLTPANDFFATATAYAGFNDWEPVIEEFDGVEMVLVPAGCFYMGSNVNSIEQPIHEICFDEPFWIDRYEVTNEQYESTGCEDYPSEPEQPRNCVTWFDAQAHCEARGGTLPTEAQWEYAARGVNNLVYPWGNEFVADNVVYSGNSEQTAPIGSRPDDVSWVGAHDMSGNVWEWTSSIHQSYPYDADDGREDMSDTSSIRVLRGGGFNNSSFFLRSAERHFWFPVDDGVIVGFRCVRFYP